MAHQRPADDSGGATPARQANDPTLSEDDADRPVGPTAPVQDSRPGVLLAITFLIVFAIVLVGAVVTAFVR